MSKRKIITFDIETDPFKYGRLPQPFSCDFYDGVNHTTYWGEDCLVEAYIHMQNMVGKVTIYAHNGGRFDWVYFYLMGLLENPIKLINGRIAEARCGGATIRDSYNLYPMPLSAYKKDEIDYQLMEAENREDNKDEIISYLHSDCEYLYEMVAGYIERYGYQLTIGGTAIKELRRMHPFERRGREWDNTFREFYFGGRVECFGNGIFEGDIKVIDVNSMYPHVMKNYDHPFGELVTLPPNKSSIDCKTGILKHKKLKNNTYFINFFGKNKGALPQRAKNGSLDFNVDRGVFLACSHEIKLALKHGLIEIEKINELVTFTDSISFGEYVDACMVGKIQSKKENDDIGYKLYKLMANTPYGKFGQNMDNMFDYKILDLAEIGGDRKSTLCDNDGCDHVGVACDAYQWALECDYGDIEIWKKKANVESYYDVAIAASITSASRAVLLEAILDVDNPIYCDTDSIIYVGGCGEKIKFNSAKLGYWDIEAVGTYLCVAGKKMYALWDKSGKCIKMSSKGVKVDPIEIEKLCKGDSIVYMSDAPAFKLSGQHEFTQRILGAEKHTKLFDKFSNKK